MIRRLRAFLLGFVLLLGSAVTASAVDDWVVRESSRSVAETVERLTKAIERSGAVVVAVIDHQAAAKRAGLDLPPSTVVTFASPRLETPLIQADRRSALDLPLRMLIWEEGGITRVGYIAAPVLSQRYGLGESERELTRLGDAMNSLAAAAVARGEGSAETTAR